MLQPYGKPPRTGNYTPAEVFRVQSLLCRPRYSMGTVTLQINTTNNDIVALEVQHQSFARVTPELSIPATVLYMNSPLSGDSLDTVADAGSGAPFNAGAVPVADIGNVTDYAWYYFYNLGTDPFFNLLNITRDKDTAHYFANSTAFAEDVSALFANIMAQVANAFGRVNETVPASGIMTGHESRVFVRQWVLRMMDATLVMLAIVAALCSTVWRPKTCLHEDPNNLAAVSVVLASTKRSGLGTDAWLPTPRAGKPASGRDTQVRLSLDGTSNPVIVQSGGLSFQEMQTTKSETAQYSPIAVKLVPKSALTGVLFLAIAGCLVLQIVQRRRPLLAGSDNAALAWSLVPTVILVLIGYAASAVIDVVCSLATFNKLMRNKARGTDSMTFNAQNHSAFAQIFHAIAKLRSRSLLAASFTVIAFPAIKIVAAGLYTPSVAIRSGAIIVTLDDSLANNFQKSLNISTVSGTELQQRASDFTEWTQIPDFRVPQRAGALDNLVFANMTGWMAGPNASGLSAQPGSEVRLRVPAISINATCTPFGPDQFIPYIDIASEINPQFTFDCTNTAACNRAFNQSSGLGGEASSQVGNLTWIKRYSGTASLPGSMLGEIYDTSNYSVFLADYSSVVGPVKNSITTPKNRTTWADGLPNVSAPTLRGVGCTRTFSAASVEVVFTQTTRTEIGGQDTLLPWSIADYDRSSVRIEEQLSYEWPKWLAPYSTIRGSYFKGMEPDGMLDSDTLWPERGSSRNFFEMLATYQHYHVRNLTGLLDVHQLAKATEHLYTAYCVEALTELRYYAHQFGPAAASETQVPGTLTMRQGLVRQDLGVTIALVSLLFLVLLSLIVIFIRFRSSAVLPEAPGSISARMSLLLGSRLVERLVEENVRSVADSTIWEQRFGLGWWRVDGGEKLRWGVDVGLLDTDLKCKPPPWIEEGEEQRQQQRWRESQQGMREEDII
ncbi:hypothetical protein LTR50_004064 [Elasticomyces elasticus]|nr:hypothetical protein LTR50_004064 [Elasticomyces elasticus]